ncbi:MAG: 50S ribosomal protein L1 [Deltaproteobacteria bacterium RIFCSPLOWO2_02_FULL_50_16]|nr:MAG: 50S ribosomal protein L1 [Deltaproteobacteria bacterium GWA2_50_8]OGQ25902.1 MAG: 50S ribosomal protein L1 [Deltaproteobacteria bacterium RIFCSPHIGHO2_02_FULL_50_15]OGQ55946.1 MAG: 50S ribosomal protein L1 [Deltaproteobacteria bacterium RIFCSPLOWO2_02_FULL_50_16]OGQ65641.1 MAG: 50S ribosomal protein L1 [Deltaproteobacteria bacterium RIFCSPLOWO2_12_FULL_50_11]
MGKKFKVAKEKVVLGKNYDVDEALKLLAEIKYTKFDETVDIALNLGVDPRQSDQTVRGALALPHGLGKKIRVIVFAKGEKEKEAREAGADETGAEDLVDKISKGWMDFDKVIATPDMMSIVSKLGKILGPRGLMPNPKLGTVTQDIKKAVQESKTGRVEFRIEKAGIVHVSIGKVSFDSEKLKANLLAIIDSVMRAKPSSSKGVYLKKACLSSTMGPGIRLDAAKLQTLAGH